MRAWLRSCSTRPSRCLPDRADAIEMIALQRRDRPAQLVGDDLRVPDHGVHRRTELVADGRDEVGLRLVRELGDLLRQHGRLVGRLLRSAEMRAHDGLRAHHAEREHERPLVLVEDAGLWPRQAKHAAQLTVRPDGNDGCRGCAGADHRGAPRGVAEQFVLRGQEEGRSLARHFGERDGRFERQLVEHRAKLGGEADGVDDPQHRKGARRRWSPGEGGGKGPSVTTTALVAPSAESACSSTSCAASSGPSASVSDPLSAESARSRWLAPEMPTECRSGCAKSRVGSPVAGATDDESSSDEITARLTRGRRQKRR